MMVVVAQEAKTEPSKKPVKIGIAVAITGPASWLGEPERNTAMMYVEEINKAGGVNGYPIELIVEDTEGDETKAVNAVNKLITKDGVVAIIGPSRSGESIAVAKVAEQHKIPLISCAAAEAITLPIEEKHYVFKTPQKDSDAAVRILEHMKKKGYKKIGILSESTGFGDLGRKQLIKYAPQYGITIAADETYAPKDTDMTPQLTKMNAAGVEAIVNWSIVPAQSQVPIKLRQLGMPTPLYQSHGFGNIKFAQAAGAAAEGIIFPCGRLLVAESLPDDHPQKKVLMDYKKKYEERFKESVSTFGGHAYDALFIIVEAIKKAGEPTPDKIRSEIEKIKGFVGTAGIFNFSPEEHNGLTKDAFEMLTVKDGKFTVLKEQ
jgi:branched-chain amino acid transport system substrate-binding protein